MAGIQRRIRRRNRGLGFLPAELEDEILVRLPVKSIIRLESVCNEWFSKFRSNSFKQLYEQHRSSNKLVSRGVHKMKLEDLYEIAPALKKKMAGQISVIGPLKNGIYCLTAFNDRRYSAKRPLLDCQIALCNPAICQFKFLPPFPEQLDSDGQYDISRQCRLVCGFDTVTCSDYRVVVVVNYGFYLDCFLAFVYSSSSDKWETLVHSNRNINVNPLRATAAVKQRGGISHLVTPREVCSQRLLNGCWHWMTVQRDGTYLTVLAFNFINQSFKLIAGPPGHVNTRHPPSTDVLVLHEHLAVIHPRGDGFRFIKLAIWMMTDYGVEQPWTKIFNIRSNLAFDFISLYRIDYSLVQTYTKEESGTDAIFIERVFFTSKDYYRGLVIDSLDHHGRCQKIVHHLKREGVYFNTAGISSYKESMERVS